MARSARRGPLGRLRADHGDDRRRQGAWPEAVHAGGTSRAPSPTRSGIATKAMAARRAPRARLNRRATSDQAAPEESPESLPPLPDFIAPQLCQLGRAAADGTGWVHEIKFDGYRMQLRVEDGKVEPEDPQGPRLDREISARSPKAAASLPDCIIDGEIVALDEHGAPDFAALQAALSEQKTERSRLLRLRSAVRRRRRSARAAVVRAQGRLASSFCSRPGKPATTLASATSSISRRGGDAVLRSACQLSLEGIVSKRLDAPYQSGPDGQLERRRNAGPGTKW